MISKERISQYDLRSSVASSPTYLSVESDLTGNSTLDEEVGVDQICSKTSAKYKSRYFFHHLSPKAKVGISKHTGVELETSIVEDEVDSSTLEISDVARDLVEAIMRASKRSSAEGNRTEQSGMKSTTHSLPKMFFSVAAKWSPPGNIIAYQYSLQDFQGIGANVPVDCKALMSSSLMSINKDKSVEFPQRL